MKTAIYHATELIEYYASRESYLKSMDEQKKGDANAEVIDNLECPGTQMSLTEFTELVRQGYFDKHFGKSWS